MTKCRCCASECPKEKGKRSSKFFCSNKCYLMKNVEITSSCWFSNTSIRKDGYSSLKVDGKEVLAHRLSYKIFISEIPEDKLVCHKCDVRNCINPDHLYLGDDSTNAIDRQSRNKSCSQSGQNNHRSKLTDAHVMDIRKMYEKGYRTKALSKFFSVTNNQIWGIVKRKKWIHI